MQKEVTAVKSEESFHEGLEGVVAAESSICLIDGQNSKLMYRGYDIHELTARSNFEEITYLLYYGKLPISNELSAFRSSLAAERALPGEILRLLSSFPKGAHPMAALRSAVSLLAFYDSETEDKSPEANFRKAIRLTAKVPTLVATIDRLRAEKPVIEPKLDASWSTAKNFLYMMKGKEGTAVENTMLDKYLILLAEHDLNASTFAARITASTLSDIYSAIASAVGTLKGDLHGSANTRTMESLLAIGDVSRVDSFVEESLRAKRKFMGFGHRIYKGPDPRAKDLHDMAKALADSNAEQAKWYAISKKLESAVWEKKKLNCNVDFYSASVLYTLGVPVDLFTPLFAISRMAGWTAHVLEQYNNNRLIRPVSQYTGSGPRAYVPIDGR